MLMASERTINVVSPTLDDEWCIYAEPIEREGFADLGCSVTLGTTTGIAMGKEESLSNVCTCTEWCERNQHS